MAKMECTEEKLAMSVLGFEQAQKWGRWGHDEMLVGKGIGERLVEDEEQGKEIYYMQHNLAASSK